MAVTAKLYGKAGINFLKGNIPFLSGTIKIMLVTSAYTPDQDNHEFKSSVTNEITGTGYTARGQALTNKTVTYDSATNQSRLDADNAVWSAATITARGYIVYLDTGVDATSILIAYGIETADVSSTAADFTVTFDTIGIGYYAAS